MTAIRFDPWAELAAIENAECEGGSAKVAKVAKVAPPNVPAEWADGVARLITLPPPTMVHRPRWHLAVKDARRFLRDWAGQASALGWTTLDVFGAHPTHPVERVDSAGLIILLHGDEVVAITRDSACTRTPTGATLIFYRRPRPDAVLLWDLGGMPPTAAEAARHSKATEALADIVREAKRVFPGATVTGINSKPPMDWDGGGDDIPF